MESAPRLRKSAFIRLGITTAMALTLRCGGPQRVAQRCVDDYGRVVEDWYCEQNPVPLHPYHWYYGGRGFFPGQVASGGSDRPTSGATAVRTSSPGFSRGAAESGSGAVRGGFGATAEGGGGGE
ncbi:MAG TPA: hypothetical protein VGF16_20585 [Bryobacteraceae bacterium]